MYRNVGNEAEESSYAQGYPDPYVTTTDGAIQAQGSWTITTLAQTTGDNVHMNMLTQQDNLQPHNYVNTKHSGKHEDIL